MGDDTKSAATGEPQLLILTSLASGPKHGYALIQDIGAFAGVRLGPGTLYGAIGRLEGQGLIEGLAADGRRRPYRLTPEGHAALSTALADWDAIVREGRTRLAGRVAAPALRTEPA
ncbi:MAG TPA: PadR family transcriptional regulator [Gaiellales bacterium]